MKKSGKSSQSIKSTTAPDKPAKAGKKSGAELSEQELDKIAGGPTGVERPIQ